MRLWEINSVEVGLGELLRLDRPRLTWMRFDLGSRVTDFNGGGYGMDETLPSGGKTPV